MRLVSLKPIKQISQRFSSLLLAAIIIVFEILLPFTVPKLAFAASSQMTNRSLTLASGVPGTSQIFTYGFTTINTQNIGSLQFKACTTASGAAGSATCTAPTGLNINGVSAAESSRSGWTGANTFTRDGTGGADCTPANNVLCMKRTAQSETAGARTLAISNQIPPTTANSSFFIMITTYTDNLWTLANKGDFGIVASAVVQTLSVNATVDEVLQFCVGNTTTDSGSSAIVSNSTTVNDCSNVSGTSLNLGVS